MKRWRRTFKTPLWLLALCLAFVACLLPTVADAQGVTRTFPDKAKRGVFQVTMPPEILLDGAPARLSPGARIKGQNNLIVMSGTLVGQKLRVNYVRDGQGLIHDVWILNDAEAKQKRAGNDTTSNIRFESDTPPAAN